MVLLLNKLAMGLNKWAKNFVKSAKMEESGEFHSRRYMMGDYPLCKYTFPDGRVYFEKVQLDLWPSDVSLVFLVLQNEQGEQVPESLWTEEEIYKHADDVYAANRD